MPEPLDFHGSLQVFHVEPNRSKKNHVKNSTTVPHGKFMLNQVKIMLLNQGSKSYVKPLDSTILKKPLDSSDPQKFPSREDPPPGARPVSSFSLGASKMMCNLRGLAAGSSIDRSVENVEEQEVGNQTI